MLKTELIGPELPNIPWEERPQNCSEVVWRSQRNPIITRDAAPNVNSIFNSAVVPFEGGFAGVFRCDNTARDMQLHAGMSADGIHWELEPQRIQFRCEDAEIGRFVYGYDPRVCWLEDRYYVTWCNGYHGPTIGVGHTYDFKTFYQTENAFLPYNRNGVLFPRKINGEIRDAQPAQRYGPYTIWRHILQPESGHDSLGLSPACHGSHRGMAGHENRRGAYPHRNVGRVASDLPRRAYFVQWLCV